jgi:hypothetical protein
MTHLEFADKVDKTFMFLYSKQDGVISGKSIEQIEGDHISAIRILEEINNCGFTNKVENSSPSHHYGQAVYNYSINGKGIKLIETIPDAFKEKPYSYQLKLDEEKQSVIAEKEEIDYKLKKVTLKSIPTNKTVAKWAVFVAVIAILAPIVVYYINKDNTTKTELISPDLNKIQQTQKQELQILKSVLDSLQKRR